MIALASSTNASYEALVTHNTFTDFRWTGGTARVHDWAVWVRKDHAMLHPGSECAGAMNTSLFSTTNLDHASWDRIAADHGGELVEREAGGGEMGLFSELVSVCPTPVQVWPMRTSMWRVCLPVSAPGIARRC